MMIKTFLKLSLFITFAMLFFVSCSLTEKSSSSNLNSGMQSDNTSVQDSGMQSNNISDPDSGTISDNSDSNTNSSKENSMTGTSSELLSGSSISGSTASSISSSEEIKRLKESDFILNKSLWATPKIRPEGFIFEIQFSSMGEYSAMLARSTIDNLKLGEYISAVSTTIAAEWGYSFTHLDGQIDGAGRKIEAGYNVAPKDRKIALEVIRRFLFKQYIGTNEHPWASMNGHYPWHHYAAEWGFDQISSEIGESINNYQWHIALTRGAARQYSKPWFIDFSAWHGPSITDYSTFKIWGTYSGPDNGHSMSLLERSYFMSYMSGADSIVAEAGSAISFYNKVDKDGNYIVSPYGLVGKKLYDFSVANPDVGSTYTPFSIVLDYYHGAYSGFDDKKAFYFFDYNAGDFMTWDLIDMFFPGGWEVMGKNEVGTLVNGPYGDTSDILLQNASQAVLNSYPCLILSGDIKLSAAEAARYKTYVEQGGTLILNSAYISYFPEYKQSLAGKTRYDITSGKGKVIVYGSDYKVNNLDAIIREQLEKFIPFRLNTDIQYIVNVKDGSLYITLINNDGITKTPLEKPIVDNSKDKNVNVTYTGNKTIKSVSDIKNDIEIAITQKNMASIIVKAGEIAILEFKFE